MNTLVDMISGMEVKEDDPDFMNAIDYMFKGLEKRKPDCFAVKQYKKYKLASGKTARRPYVQVAVNDNADIYISHRGECPALFNYVEDTWNATFREQMGGTYFFVTDADTLMVSAEVYWAKFTVWTIPNVTLVGG